MRHCPSLRESSQIRACLRTVFTQLRTQLRTPLSAGAAASDDDGGIGATADKLAEIDLSTPLREDELLPKVEHRRVNDAGTTGVSGSGKGKGRARNLHAAVAGDDAPAGDKKTCASRGQCWG